MRMECRRFRSRSHKRNDRGQADRLTSPRAAARTSGDWVRAPRLAQRPATREGSGPLGALDGRAQTEVALPYAIVATD